MTTARVSTCLVILALALAPAAAARGDERAPSGAFVSASDALPSVLLNIRYRTAHNFIGRRIVGYREPLCIVTRRTAAALRRVQRSVRRAGYTLKLYDCYRPQRAVDQFVRWGRRLRDQRMKREFYPRVRKSRVFEEGYIAEQSGHSRGSTVDLTLVRLPARADGRYRRGQPLVDCAAPAGRRFPDNSIDMGTGYDCFDPLSHPLSPRIRGRQRANRLRLRRAMVAQDFEPLETEWWHFTLADEPYPETYFDFPVARRSLR